MIHVTVTKEPTGRIHSFEMKGHANYAKRGKDLVCAAASAVSFGAVNAVIELTGEEPVIQQGADGGYLYVEFPQSQFEDTATQLIVKAMIVSLQTIERDYGQYIQIKFTQ